MFYMRILGIESSCDETGVALYDGDKGLLEATVGSAAASPDGAWGLDGGSGEVVEAWTGDQVAWPMAPRQPEATKGCIAG